MQTTLLVQYPRLDFRSVLFPVNGMVLGAISARGGSLNKAVLNDQVRLRFNFPIANDPYHHLTLYTLERQELLMPFINRMFSFSVLDYQPEREYPLLPWWSRRKAWLHLPVKDRELCMPAQVHNRKWVFYFENKTLLIVTCPPGGLLDGADNFDRMCHESTLTNERGQLCFLPEHVLVDLFLPQSLVELGVACRPGLVVGADQILGSFK